MKPKRKQSRYFARLSNQSGLAAEISNAPVRANRTVSKPWMRSFTWVLPKNTPCGATPSSYPTSAAKPHPCFVDPPPLPYPLQRNENLGPNHLFAGLQQSLLRSIDAKG
jgi:hypothetical protein